jgi:hypothetical protein
MCDAVEQGGAGSGEGDVAAAGSGESPKKVVEAKGLSPRPQHIPAAPVAMAQYVRNPAFCAICPFQPIQTPSKSPRQYKNNAPVHFFLRHSGGAIPAVPGARCSMSVFLAHTNLE